jgi:hypothetical protein
MRQEIRQAVQAMFLGVRWGSPQRGFVYTSNRLQTWDDAPAQPALYTPGGGGERWTSISNLAPKRDLEFPIFVYQDLGKNLADPDPGLENDLIMDALEARILQYDTPDQRQTLGGLVHHARIDGTVSKDSGDLDGQGIIMFSVWALVP